MNSGIMLTAQEWNRPKEDETAKGIYQSMRLKVGHHQAGHCMVSANAWRAELSLVAMKYVPPTSVQLTLFDQ